MHYLIRLYCVFGCFVLWPLTSSAQEISFVGTWAGHSRLAPVVTPDRVLIPLAEPISCDCGTPDCDQGCVVPCGYCCRSLWRVEADSILLHRDASEDVTLINDQACGCPLLGASELEFDYRPGAQLRLVRENPTLIPGLCGLCTDWEISYFGIDSWDAVAAPDPTISQVAVGPGLPILSSGPGASFRASYGSDLHNVEWNVRGYWNDCIAFVAGFRWMELSEDFIMDEVNGGIDRMYSINTNNHLWGGQVGSDFGIASWGWRLRVQGNLRAGLFINQADQSTLAPAFRPLVPLAAEGITARDDTTAFVGSAGVTAIVGICNGVGVRMGYQVMWVDGVALAPEQLNSTNLVAPNIAASLNMDGDLLYQGATIGLELSW